MAFKIALQGLEELRAALRNLPEHIAQEAGDVVRSHAAVMALDATQAYPEGPTGNLRRGVTTETNSSKFGTGAIVRNRAQHAFIFEKGTVPRETKKGWKRGSMPPAPESERFIPKAIRARARMVNALIVLLERNGLTVNR